MLGKYLRGVLILGVAIVVLTACGSKEVPMENPLDRSIPGVTLSDVEVQVVVALLRASYKVPISFIEAEDGPRLTLDVAEGPLKGLLDKIVLQSPEYRYAVVGGRLVLYPNLPLYDAVVEGVQITNLSRLEAGLAYALHLNREVPGFERLAGPVLKGAENSPVYKAVVSLSPRDTVLNHLVQLLGTDTTVVFSIRKTQSGGLVLLYEQVG